MTNALGQLIRVDEPDAGGQLGDASSPTQATFYTYDTLNNLTTVDQGVQTRNFAYNSLSRLVSAQNPESGTIQYSYDASGNLTRKADARGVVTAYTYDALNRVLTRAYTGETGYTTPNVSYFYDNLPNAKGRLTKVSSSVSTTEYTSFDILGRVLAAKQTTDGGDAAGYSTGYTYNLSGALIEETYPSGRKVKNVLDNDGELALVQSARCGVVNGVTATCSDPQGYFSYAKSFTYNASGAITSMQLGNGRWESTQFNSRLQPTQIGLGTVQNATDKLKLDYSYGTTANNGNVLSQTITVPTVGSNNGFTAVQTYNYDELNRLKDATENVTPVGGSASQSWKQTFVYDRYGNRRFDEANTTMPSSFVNPAITNPTISTSNNRLTSPGYSYDASGNTTADAGGQTYVYDAENKMISASNSNSTIGQYSYDGDGKRIKKIVPDAGEVTIFVYDAAGKLIGEYSTVLASTNDAKVNYLTSDHLGSPRINTDATGAVIARHDYHPFGEEIFTAQRTTGLNYSADSVRKQFTGYQRDEETDLDFAQARMYANHLGRFNSVDPLLSSGTLVDPISWNRYLYACDNPFLFVDPTGMYVWGKSLGGDASDDDLNKTAAGAAIVEKRNKIKAIINGMDAMVSEALKKGTITKEQADALNRATKAYGSFGQAGVTVEVGKVKEGEAETKWGTNGDGKTVAWTSDENSIATPNIVVTFEGSITIGKVMHEGSHAADRNDYITGYNKRIQELIAGTSTDSDPTKLPENITLKESETRAYGVSSAIAQMTNDSASEVWKRGISESDRKTLIANKVRSLDLKGRIYAESYNTKK
ncbi:MAG TPA: RHS repeat-associated core domain-containing protein [Pyrinomonadaceae bacterium]|nr:RHS repeat-associated core domain-containing protein [Pyrinomonadaceae bacterium]